MKFKSYFLIILTLMITSSSHSTPAQILPILWNGGFEGGTAVDGKSGGIPNWQQYGEGYVKDSSVHHRGNQCIRCKSVNAGATYGAVQSVTFNQPRPLPFIVSGWSKAVSVQGGSEGDYSIYVDVTYTDGSALWGQTAPFTIGTHTWERRQLEIYPLKPIRSASIYALFRNHSGTAWFDDFSLYTPQGSSIFDSRKMQLPSLVSAGAPFTALKASDGLQIKLDHTGQIESIKEGMHKLGVGTGAFFLRDVRLNGSPVPFRGRVQTRKGGGVELRGYEGKMHLLFRAALYPRKYGIGVEGWIKDTSNLDRAVTVYLAIPVGGPGWTWGQELHAAERIGSQLEYSSQVPVSVGANGTISLYPFGGVADGEGGAGIANQINWPTVDRIFYNASHRLLVIAWDFALTGKSHNWPAPTARFRCTLFPIPPGPPAWTFRQCLSAFYHLHQRQYRRPVAHAGIWMPFTDPKSVTDPKDFGFMFHEGDNSVSSDNSSGILSFRYTEPSSYWMPMPEDMPRTYSAAIKLIQERASEPISNLQPMSSLGNPTPQDWARAVINSADKGADGRYIIQFLKEPWNDGCLFIMDPVPNLPSAPGEPTRSSLDYTVENANRLYSSSYGQKHGFLSGEYLDSLESWTDTEDYRLSHLYNMPYPLAFDAGNLQPVVPQWFSVFAFTQFVSKDLHKRSRLLMANTTPVKFSIFAPWVDIMGIEVNWLQDQHFQPDSDSVMSMRRCLSGKKPYLLLMDTDFNSFDHSMVEAYFKRCLFYDIFPSMFSQDAADNSYWQNPSLYNRDRDLFKKYIPLFELLYEAGWEPIPDAMADNPEVRIERYGTQMYTLLNRSRQKQIVTIQCMTSDKISKYAEDLLTRKLYPVIAEHDMLLIHLTMSGRDTVLLKLR